MAKTESDGHVTSQPKKGKPNILRKLIYIVLIVLALLLVILKSLEWAIESNLQTKINSNPERAYNFTFSDLDIDTFFRGITLNNVSIEPLNPKNGTIIRGRVDYATINGLVLSDLFFNDILNIHEIAFKQPKFEVTLSADTVQKTSGKGMQKMFGDILSRANINNFRIDKGSVVLIDPISKAIKGQVKKVNINAIGINTDSLKFANIIPFEMQDLEIELEDIMFDSNEYTHVGLGRFHYKLSDKEIILNNISLDYSIDWVEVSKRLGFQNDIVQLQAKQFGIHLFEPSNNFYTQLDIVAQKISIDNFNIVLQRNKNIPRPKDTPKPIFQEIIKAIPIAISIDSVQISKSSVTYGELGVNRNATGSIKIQDINGVITGVTNMPEEQKRIDKIEAKIKASLLGKTGILVGIQIPYNSKSFLLDVDVEKMDMKDLNTFLKPLAGIEMVSGQMKRLKFHMEAGEYQSKNKLVFDYNNLNLKLNDEKKNDEKEAILTAIANGALREENMPNEKKYLIAEYKSDRNIYRSPVNYIIKGLTQGFARIVPGKFVQRMIIKDDKKKKKKNKK